MNHQTLWTFSSKPTNWAFGCNIAVIVVGTIIAVCGILLWAVHSPRDNALRQILPALWLIQGLVGLLIAAIGVLGATLVSALNMRREPRTEPDVPP
jgi:TRAP-type C4-dicarboxylate transport system permease small subunit